MVNDLLDAKTQLKSIVSLPFSHRNDPTEDGKSTIEMKETEQWSRLNTAADTDIGEFSKSIYCVESVRIRVVAFEINNQLTLASSASSVNVTDPKEGTTNAMPPIEEAKEDELLVSSHLAAGNALTTSSLEDELLVGGQSTAGRSLTTGCFELEPLMLTKPRNFHDRGNKDYTACQQELLVMTETLKNENRYF
jgi:hypothetical protein